MSDGAGSARARSVGSERGRDAVPASLANGTHAWTAEPGGLRPLPRGPQKPVLSAVFEHGKRHVYVGLALGCVVTLVVHGIASVRAETALFDMLHWVHETQKDMKDYFWSTYEVEAPKDEKKEAPPPEPPPEVKEVAPVAQQLPVKIDDPYKNAPPPTKIAEAAPLLTAPGEDPYDGVATGNNANAMGLQSGAGTEKHGDTVRPGPSPDIGAPAGTVTAVAPREDHSKPPTIAGGSAWSCPDRRLLAPEGV